MVTNKTRKANVAALRNKNISQIEHHKGIDKVNVCFQVY